MKADLFAKRKQRTSRERLFQQTNRHELTLRTGYYASDTFDGVVYAQQAKVGSVPLYTFGIFALAYAYHMTEDFAVEATAGRHAADLAAAVPSWNGRSRCCRTSRAAS